MGGFVSMLIKLGLYCWSNDFNETSDVPLFFLLWDLGKYHAKEINNKKLFLFALSLHFNVKLRISFSVKRIYVSIWLLSREHWPKSVDLYATLPKRNYTSRDFNFSVINMQLERRAMSLIPSRSWQKEREKEIPLFLATCHSYAWFV